MRHSIFAPFSTLGLSMAANALRRAREIIHVRDDVPASKPPKVRRRVAVERDQAARKRMVKGAKRRRDWAAQAAGYYRSPEYVQP